jgi:hypothetical protein
LIQPRRLLFTCIILSLTVHLCLLTFFYYHPLLLQNLKSLFGITAATPTRLEVDEEGPDLAQKNQILEEVFQKILVFSPHFQQPYDLNFPNGSLSLPLRKKSSMNRSFARKDSTARYAIKNLS